MKSHRISAGAIVVNNDKVLLVRHQLQDRYDFWVAPGGGVHDEEDILAAAEREAMEETGLIVEAVKPVYLEQFYQPTIHHIKTWVLCTLKSGELSVAHPEAAREHIVEAQYFSHADMQKQQKKIFPEVLCEQFWEDYAAGFPECRFLGIREMEFY